MRKTILIIILLSINNFLNAQTFIEKIALKTCTYIDTIDNLDKLQDSVRSSIATAMSQVMIESTFEEKKVIGTVEGIRGLLKDVIEILPAYCYNVRKLMLEEKTKNFYKISDFEKANLHFDKGNIFLEMDDFKNAMKEFKTSLKYDENFIFSIDHLAISYRKQKNFKKALKFYHQSLEIFPEGDLALLNIAVVYSLVEDYDNSLKYYDKLIYLYPKNPEGYFGLAKILFITENYEKSLDNLFISHRIYAETESNYTKDSKQLINIIYTKLKEIDKLDLFDKKAKEYNISIND